jgi:pyruvate kinase
MGVGVRDVLFVAEVPARAEVSDVTNAFVVEI